jgi:putative tricarboxylic transport membrane protein
MRRDTFLKSLAAMAAAGALPNLAWAGSNIKMMIPANPGGGWDGTARALGEALRDAKVADTVTFENKGGAAGAIGLAQFFNASKGDHVSWSWVAALGGLITAPGDPRSPPARLTTDTTCSCCRPTHPSTP